LNEQPHLPSFHHRLLAPPKNTMVQDAASSHLHIVSCYEDGEDDSNSEIIMKSPLIITTLEAEEQTLLENDKQHGKWLSGRGDLLFVWVHNGNFVAPALDHWRRSLDALIVDDRRGSFYTLLDPY
jgi:hypothetical protein